jgi:hypothetical protein
MTATTAPQWSEGVRPGSRHDQELQWCASLRLLQAERVTILGGVPVTFYLLMRDATS